MIPWWVDGNHLRSYAQIHEQMVYGFELSWRQKACKMKFKDCYTCNINDKHQIYCQAKKGKIDRYLLFIVWVIQMLSENGIVPFVVVKFILGAPLVTMLLLHIWRRHLAINQNAEEFLQSNNNFLPIRYSYSDGWS
ncbi:uncharacterized protein LOC130136749 [Syzygium oleosum]|uniref:uncharacterized protein LOC130136749 n=1 Tax=Syzygium oleosum TaxID=219896 RepID=UPI0024BAF3F2|nr:uncharacterized protein LOC130136749 [Syzygium oleosum]